MPTKTKIEWTESTWSPIVGCQKVSPGCENCYAERMAKRQKSMGRAKYQTVVDKSGWTGEVALCSEREMTAPLRWKKSQMIFVCSMSDLFCEKVPFHWIEGVYDVIERAEQHIFQILTKRPEIMLDYHLNEVIGNYVEEYIPNLWLGTTVENSDYLHRIKDLCEIPAAKRFVSFEPLLGEIDDYYYLIDGSPRGCFEKIDWIIIGCETGPGARECKTEWVRELALQAEAAGIPPFIKKIVVNGKPNGNPDEWPEDLQKYRQMPERKI